MILVNILSYINTSIDDVIQYNKTNVYVIFIGKNSFKYMYPNIKSKVLQ